MFLLKRAWFLMLLAAAGCVAGYFFARYMEQARITLVVDAAISQGAILELYINEQYGSPWRVPRRTDRRTEYYFYGVPPIIRAIRLDPSDTGNAEIRIYGLRLLSKAGKLVEFSPSALAEWQIINAEVGLRGEKEGPAEECLFLRSTSTDPILSGAPQLSLRPGLGSLLYPLFSGPADITYLVLIIGLLGVFGGLALCTRLPCPLFFFPAFVIGTYLPARISARFVASLPAEYVSAAQAVGYATYIPLSYQAQVRTFLASVFCVVALSGFFALLSRRFSAVSQGALPGSMSPSRGWAVFGWSLVVCLVAVYFLPRLGLITESIHNLRHASLFDEQNIVSWQYAVWKGQLPYRDFWYPYSGSYLLTLPWPPQLYYNYALAVVSFAILSWSVLWFVEYHIVRFALSMLVIALGFLTGGFPAFVLLINRYLLPVTIVLWLPAVIGSRNHGWLIVHAAWTFCVGFLEISQLIYAAPGCALVWLGELWDVRRKAGELQRTLKSMALWFLGFITFVLFQLLVWQANGQLSGVLAFYVSIFRDMVANCGLPADVASWFALRAKKENLAFLATLAVCQLSVMHFFAARGQSMPRRLVPLALCTVAGMVFGKQLIRPHLADHLMSIPVITMVILWSAHCIERTLSHRFSAVCVFMSAFVFSSSLSVSSVSLKGPFSKISANLRALPQSVKLVLAGSAPWQEMGRLYFAPQAFELHGIRGDVVKTQLLAAVPDLETSEFFVLGDDSYLYILFSRELPPYISVYNQAPLWSQAETLAWLDRHQPEYIIWNVKALQFDGLANVVRIPLVFEKIACNYAPYAQAGTYTILKQRSPFQEVDWNFWRQALGDTIDLGFIPGVSGARSAVVTSATSKAGEQAVQYAVVKVSRPRRQSRDSLEVAVGDMKFTLRFTLHPRVTAYYIRLDRLWFYSLAKCSGLQAKISPVTAKGRKVQLSHLALRQPILY